MGDGAHAAGRDRPDLPAHLFAEEGPGRLDHHCFPIPTDPGAGPRLTSWPGPLAFAATRDSHGPTYLPGFPHTDPMKPRRGVYGAESAWTRATCGDGSGFSRHTPARSAAQRLRVATSRGSVREKKTCATGTMVSA